MIRNNLGKVLVNGTDIIPIFIEFLLKIHDYNIDQ